jgi:hypothetical protein
MRQDEKLQDGIHTYPEKSSVCGLFLAFFKLPTRDKTFSRPNSTPHSQTSSNNKKQEKKKPTTINKTKKKNSHKTPKHSSTTEPPSLSFFFTTTTTQLQNPKPDLDAS